MARQNQIQWLRALAALEVVLWHSDLATKHFSNFYLHQAGLYQLFGGIGVELFFMVSGYVICLRAPSYSCGTDFILARIERIFPLYWIFTTLVLIAFIINPAWRLHELEFTFPRILQSYLVLPQAEPPVLGVGWTLEYEMIFYSIVAILMITFGALALRRKMAIAFFIVSLAVIGFVFKTRAPDFVWLSHLFSPYMLAFGFGWWFRCVDESNGSLSAMTAGLIMISAFTVILAADDRDILLICRMALAGIAFTLFCLWRSTFAKDIVLNRWASLLGDASYSLYLSHWFVLSVLGKMLGAWQPPQVFDPVVRLLGALLCVFVSIFCFWYIEKPFDRLMRGRHRGPREKSNDEKVISNVTPKVPTFT